MKNRIGKILGCTVIFFTLAQDDIAADQFITPLTVRAKSSLYIPSDFTTVVFKINYYLDPAIDIDHCQADAASTTENIIADLIQSGIPSSNIYLGEYSRPLCTYSDEETGPIYSVYQDVNIDLWDVSELEGVLTELAKFPQVGVSNLRPRLREPEKHFDRVIQQAKEEAKKVATEIGDKLDMSVGDVLQVKQTTEEVAFPKDQIAGFDGILYRGSFNNLLNEPLQWAELQSEVEMTYSLTDR